MSNLLQSSQNKQTTAPCYYNNYLCGLATKGEAAACKATYAGASPLQTAAFCAAQKNFGSSNPDFQQASNLIGCASKQNITGASAPYLQSGANYLNESGSTNVAGSAQPYLAKGTGYLCQAANTSVSNAGQPYINKGTALLCKGSNVCVSGAASPYLKQGSAFLCRAANVCVSGAASPYFKQAACTNTGQLAQCYMSPYLASAVQNTNNVGMRNIQQNLDPMAAAAAVGSGQFGSQRGAQAQGQIEANAMQCLNATTANMENAAYRCAMAAAEAKQSLLGTVGSSAGQLAAACGSEKLNAGTGLNAAGATAGQLAAACGSEKLNAGTGLNAAGSTAGNLAAACAAVKQNAGSGINSAGTALGQLTAACAGVKQNAGSGLGQIGCTAGKEATNQASILNTAGQNMASTGSQAERANIACLCALSKLGAECQAIRQNASCFCLAKENKLAGILQGAQIPTGVKTTLCMSPLSALSTVGSGIAGILCKNPNLLGNIAKGIGCVICTIGCFFSGGGGSNLLSNGLARGGIVGCASKQFNGGLPRR